MMFPPLLAYLEGKNTTEFLASLEILPSDYCIITYPEEETKNVNSQRRLLKHNPLLKTQFLTSCNLHLKIALKVKYARNTALFFWCMNLMTVQE